VFHPLVAEEDSPDRFLPGERVGSDGQPLLDRCASYRVMQRPRQGEIGLQADSAFSFLHARDLSRLLVGGDEGEPPKMKGIASIMLP